MTSTTMTRVICALCFVAVGASAAEAQDYKSHWGVSGSMVPRWSFPRALADTIDIETNMQGTEFRAGIVRGSDAGGDWGVSFVKKLVDDDSIVQHRQTACVQMAGVRRSARAAPIDVTQQARMTGVEAYLFMPFADIKRVQIGRHVRAGRGQAGRARATASSSTWWSTDATATADTEAVGEVPFRDTFHDWKELSPFPIGRARARRGRARQPRIQDPRVRRCELPGVPQCERARALSIRRPVRAPRFRSRA